MNQKLFFILRRPIEAVLASISPIIDQEALSQKLFFADFVKKLLFAYLEQVNSLRSLTVELQTNQKCAALGLEWIKNISEIFYESWKISKRWLLIIKNSLGKVVDNKLLMILDSC